MLKNSSSTGQLAHRDIQQLAAWSVQLRTVGNELESLDKTTEQTFLSVGDRLSGFYDRAQEISKRSGSIAARFAGVEVSSATQGLRDLLNRSGAFLTGIETDIGQDVQILQDILLTMASIKKPIIGFRKIVKNLGILATATKIESAQLNDDGLGFTTIADDVERLSVLINSGFADILTRANSVSASMEQALAGVRTLESRQKDQARSILDRTHATLTSLIEKNASSTETAGRIAGELETIMGSIGEVVSSIQFHDITRQQVEHVKEALDAAAVGLENGLAGPASELREEGVNGLILETRAVCELQKAQLADSGEQFTEAAQSIMENLRRIAGTIRGVYGHLEKLAGMEDETSSSFFSAIETEVSSAVSFFGETGDGIRKLSETVDDLTQKVKDMSGFVDDIENIGMDIELIAVNARIKAAHTGSEGAPLGVIAEAIQKLSVDAQVQKNSVSDELKKIISTVDRLHSQSDSSSNRQTIETESVLKELDALLGTLRTINKGALSDVESIKDEGRRLAMDIESAAEGITVQQEFAARIGAGIKRLEAVVAESRVLLTESDESGRLDMLRDLERNYTMHSERSIHESYRRSNGSGAVPRSSISHPEKGRENHFSQNVELF